MRPSAAERLETIRLVGATRPGARRGPGDGAIRAIRHIEDGTGPTLDGKARDEATREHSRSERMEDKWCLS